MQITNLIVDNVGVYRGRHSFDLAPAREPDGSQKHVTVIVGHNGAGKSTLFQALALALHGSLAVSDRLSRQDYSKYLYERLHRQEADRGANVVGLGGVEVSLRYVQSGRPLDICIERTWQRLDLDVVERLKIWCNGVAPEVDPSDYQGWLNDLIPPGLASLCFFDAERLSAFSSPAHHQAMLKSSLRRLLGLDLVSRLQADLDRYAQSRGGGSRLLERLRAMVREHEATIDSLDAQLSEFQLREEELSDRVAGLEDEMKLLEQRLASEGGSYAARRPALLQRLAAIEREKEGIVRSLHELSNELLPFALAPELCRALLQRLTSEAEMRRREIARKAVREQLAIVEEAVLRDDIWDGLTVSEQDRQRFRDRLMAVVQGSFDGEAEEFRYVHNLSDTERQRMEGWIVQVLEVIPRQVQELGERLRSLRKEEAQIEADLHRAPDDAILEPIHAEMRRLQSEIDQAKREQQTLSEQVGALRFRREEAYRQLQRVAADLRQAQLTERQMELAERSKAALRVYEDVLIRQRLSSLEQALVESFNAICGKENLLSWVTINPDDFEVVLKGADGEILNLANLSAGERQLYAMALLWALRKVSGRQIPLFIDTPLARLDALHRERLVHEYFPAVSDQVVLFATDTEADGQVLADIAPYIARVYKLEFVPEQGETIATANLTSISQNGDFLVIGAAS